MAGKGGFRPGSGRKKKPTVEEQENRRDIVLDVFNPEEWRTTVTGWMQAARATGNYALLFPLLPYLMGSPRQELTVTFDVQATAEDLAAQYGVAPERVVSLVERLKAKKVG